MKKSTLLMLLFTSLVSFGQQQFQIDTIQYKGDTENKYNLVIVAEGYTANQMATFKTDAQNVKNILFEANAYAAEKNNINIFAIHTTSVESGVSLKALNPSSNDPIQTTVLKNTRFKVYFQNSYRAYFLDRNDGVRSRQIAADHIPFTDAVLVLVNDPSQSSGRANIELNVAVATRWKGNPRDKYTINHELGHAMGGLSDAYSVFKEEGFNKTINNDPQTIRWKEHLSKPGVGIHEISANSGAYIPSTTCMMKVFNHTYLCPVCSARINNQFSTPRSNKVLPPHRIYRTNQTNGSIQLQWDPIAGATHYEIAFRIGLNKLITKTVPTNQVTFNDPSILLTESSFLTTIRAYNGSHSSKFTEFRVRGASGGAQASLPVPGNIQVSNLTSNSFKLTWANHANASNTKIRLYNSSGAVAEFNMTGSEFEFKKLSTGQKYHIQVANQIGVDASALDTHYSGPFSPKTVVQLVPLNYCASKGNSVTDEYIQNVKLETINNTSTSGNGYSDYTAISTNLTKGKSHTITITPKWTSTTYSEGYGVWIDYNQDGDFSDAGEQVFTKASSTTTPITGTFTVPTSATSGVTRMRVILRYNTTPSACGVYDFGETEDYMVNIDRDTQSPTTPGTITVSNTGVNTLTLTWIASIDNIAVTGYDIFKGSTIVGSTTATTINLTGQTLGGGVVYKIKAKDVAGNISGAKSVNVSDGYCVSKGNTSVDAYMKNVTLGSINNTSVRNDNMGYSDFTLISTDLAKGPSHTITITPHWNTSVIFDLGYGVWIDFNQDKDFNDAGEQILVKAPSQDNPITASFTIPASASLGQTKMRIVHRVRASPTACGEYSHGETEDYTVNITSGASDTQAPTAPTSLATSNIAQTTLTLNWTSATDNVAVTGYDVYRGSTVIGTVTTTMFSVTGLTAATVYTFKVRAKDAAGNVSGDSNVVNATTLANAGVSYCASKGNSVNDEYIQHLQLGSIDNTSTGGNGYSNHTSLSTALSKGTSHTITITPKWNGSKFNEGYGVWIDYNQDGDFDDAGEQVFTKAPSQDTPVTGSFIVPNGVATGRTRMRVILRFNATATACGNYDFGETEDYTVNIVAAVRARATPSFKGEDTKLLLYPNPVSNNDSLHVKLSTEGEFLYTIFNIMGGVVGKGIARNGDGIDVSGLSSGIYILQAISKNKNYTKRFIKK